MLPSLPRRPFLQEDQDTVVAFDEMPLQFHQFDLQHVQLCFVVLAADRACRCLVAR
jgi:hypothetical protein